MKINKLRQKIAIWLALGLCMADITSMATGSIMPDTNAPMSQQPQVQESANGIPLVNIAAPSAGGVSRNRYDTFSVPDKGAVLNNSYRMSQTKLAGYVGGNNNMARGSAQVIVNEVTGTNLTAMNGFLEVAGNKASVIIANPNGITVNGGGFINTSKAFLTTGVPVYDAQDNLQRLEVKKGNILIEGNGLNGREADSLSILSRATVINAGVWAKKLNIMTGAYTIETDTLKVTDIKGEDTAPTSALDVSSIGGMYAGRISLIGTEKGLGVNNSGTWIAEDTLTLSWNGDLKNSGTIYNKGNTKIDINHLENNRIIASEKNTSIAAKRNVYNRDKLLAGENMSIYAEKSLINAGHDIESGKDLVIETKDSMNNVSGHIKSGGNQQINIRDTLTNTKGLFTADGYIKMEADRLTGDGMVSSGKNADIILDKDFINTGHLEAVEKLSLAVKGNITNYKDILSHGHLVIKSKTMRNEETGEIKGTDTETISENLLLNRGLFNGKTVHIRTKHMTNENTGRIYGTTLSIETGILENLGVYKEKSPVIAAREHMNLAVAGTLTNTEHALIRAEGDLTLGRELDISGKITGKAERIENKSAYIESGGHMTLGVEHLQNSNDHFSIKNILAEKTHHEEAVGQGKTERFLLGQKGTNGVAYIERHGYVDHLYTPDGGDYDHFTTYSYDRFIYEDRIDTTDPAHISAGGNLSIETGKAVNDRSVITAGKTLSIYGGSLENIDETGHKTIKDKGNAISYWTKRVHHGISLHKRTETRTSTSDYTPADVVTNMTVIPSVSKAYTNPEYEGTTAEPYKNLKNRELVHISDSSLYHVTKDPKACYIVETDPAYTDKKTFLSSDYFFHQMQYDPDRLAKRLGDGYYESRIVRNRLMKIYGRPAEKNEYKELMDAAVRWAKENGDAPIGIALTEDQKANLKEDIVWMVETSVLLPDGQIVKALVPEVYIAKKKNNILAGTSLISAESIDIHTTNDILNRGTMIAGDTTHLSASNINNHGGIIKSSSLLEEAVRDIRNGGVMEAEKKLVLTAGRDIDFITSMHKEKNKQGYTETIASEGKAVVTGDKSTLLVKAGQDIHMKSGKITSEGDLVMQAGRDITMETETVKKYTAVTWDADNYRHENMEKDIGSSVYAKENLTVESGRDISMKAANLRADDKTVIKSGRTLSAENGQEKISIEEHHRHKEKSLLSSTTTTTHDEVHTVKAVKSTIEGDTLSLYGKKDITLTGSVAASTKGTALSAGRNVFIDAAVETNKEIHDKNVKKTGLIGSGLGFTIGTEKRKDTYTTEEIIQTGSTVGSVKGNVTISAGNHTAIKSSDIIAGKDISVAGKNVDITSKENIYKGQEEHEYKKSGLTLSAGGAAIEAAESIIAPLQRAGEVQDSRLKALYAVQAGINGRDIQKKQKTDKIINKNNALGINVSIGSTKWKDNIETIITESSGSRIAAGNKAVILSEKDTSIKGSTVHAKDILLKAGNDLNILSSQNKKETIEKTKGSSTVLGASITKGGYGISASYGKGNGQSEETGITHNLSQITAADTITADSRNDIKIAGGTIRGNKVTIESGRNLDIQSEQDKKNYTEKNRISGIGISYIPGSHVSVNGGAGKTTTDSNYESVTTQSGIYAGEKGYDIKVQENTHLKGAVIASRGNKEKNNITTGTLSWENIDNKAEYKTDGQGITASTESITKHNPLGLGYISAVPVKGKKESTTYSAIADSIITMTKEKTDKEISHDTANALHTLSEIFDKKKIEERHEYVNILSQVGFHIIGDIAEQKEKELHQKAEKARRTNNNILAENYEKEAETWKESGAKRIALHGIMGALVSQEAGDGIQKGMTGAGLNALLQKRLEKIQDPEVHKMASAAIGYLTGGKTGAAIAEQATIFNYLTHAQKKQKEALIAQAQEEGNEEQVNTIKKYYDNLENKQDVVISNLELPEQVEYDDNTEKMILQASIIYDGTDAMKEVIIAGLKQAKKQGLTEYHFGDEDYVTLNGSIGRGLGLAGGFIMDKTGNVYVIGGIGIVNGLGGTVASGKFSVDTSNWQPEDFKKAISGPTMNFGFGLYGSVNISVGKEYGSREVGGTNGISVSMTGMGAKYICNINDL